MLLAHVLKAWSLSMVHSVGYWVEVQPTRAGTKPYEADPRRPRLRRHSRQSVIAKLARGAGCADLAYVDLAVLACSGGLRCDAPFRAIAPLSAYVTTEQHLTPDLGPQANS